MKAMISTIMAFLLYASLAYAAENSSEEKHPAIFAKSNESKSIIFENAEEQKANSIMLFDSKGNLVKAEKYEAPTKLDTIEIKIDQKKEKLLSAYIEFDSGATKMLKIKFEN